MREVREGKKTEMLCGYDRLVYSDAKLTSDCHLDDVWIDRQMNEQSRRGGVRQCEELRTQRSRVWHGVVRWSYVTKDGEERSWMCYSRSGKKREQILSDLTEGEKKVEYCKTK